MIRLAFTVLVSILLLTATSNGQTSPTQKPAHPQKTPPPKTEPHAYWTPEFEQGYGVTKQAFEDMGLGALTQVQEVRLLFCVADRESKAKDSVPTVTYKCGRLGESFNDTKPEEYDKVRLYVAASGSGDEVIRGIRQRLRAMNGIEVVYSSEEADLAVNIVSMDIKAQGSGSLLGRAASVVVTKPCAATVATSTARHDDLRDAWLQTGFSSSEVVDAVVASLDTDDLEPQRKQNAAFKKLCEWQPNK